MQLFRVKACGWGEGRGRKRNILRSRSAVRPQLEWRATPVSTRGPLSVVFLSLSFCPAGHAGASQPPPPRSRPALPGHAWPSLGIHSGCFLFTACTLLYLSQQALPSTVSTCLCFFSDQPSLNPFYLLTLFIFK